MSKIDLVFLAILAFGAYSGYRKGFIAEVFFLLATITGILTAFHFSGDAGAWLKESLGWEHEFIQFAGFLFVFIIVLVLVSFMGKVLRSSIEKTLLGDFDRAFGAFIGVFKWGFLISVGLWILHFLDIEKLEEWSEESMLFGYMEGIAPFVAQALGLFFPQLKELFPL